MAHLEISDWGGYGGKHLYCLFIYKDQHIRLTHTLTEKESQTLRIEDKWEGWYKGDVVGKFDTRKQLLKSAKKVWKQVCPNAIVLEGSSCIISVQKAVFGPKDIIDKINKLYIESMSHTCYNDRMKEIDKEYDKILGRKWE